MVQTRTKEEGSAAEVVRVETTMETRPTKTGLLERQNSSNTTHILLVVPSKQARISLQQMLSFPTLEESLMKEMTWQKH